MVQIKGTIIQRDFQDNKYGNKKYWCRIKINYNGRKLTVIGDSNIVPTVGNFLTANGNFDDNSKFGYQFKATSLRYQEPQEHNAILDRLTNLGFELLDAEKLTRKHGSKIWSQINDKKLENIESEKLEEVYINFKKWEVPKNPRSLLIAEILVFFEQHDVEIHEVDARRIVVNLNENAIKIILHDIDSLCSLLDFDTIKTLGYRLNLTDQDMKTTKILSLVFSTCMEGKHMCLPLENFNQNATFDKLVEKKRLIIYENHVYPVPYSGFGAKYIILDDENEDRDDEDNEYNYNTFPKLGNYDIERYTVLTIKDVLRRKDDVNEVTFEETSTTLCSGQKDALRMGIIENFSIICGPGGTGKSHVIKAFVEYFRAVGKTFVLLASTGIASRVVKKKTDEPSRTIHSYLYKKPEAHDVMIVDECSMIDSLLMYKLVTCGLYKKLILLGDYRQLSPVFIGKPFETMIMSEKVPITMLTQNFRFDEGSDLPLVMKKILTNDTADLEKLTNGFSIIIDDNITEVIYELGKKLKKYNPNRFRIMASTNKSVNQFNVVLRNIFNPETKKKDERDKFENNDWVMMLKNDLEKDVYNGDILFTSSIGQEMLDESTYVDGEMKTRSSLKTVYTCTLEEREIKFTNTKHFKLAYCSTVHKSQGSEANISIFILDFPSQIDCRELIFTAVSRAKKSAIIIAKSMDTIKRCIERKEPHRFTCLDIMLEKLEIHDNITDEYEMIEQGDLDGSNVDKVNEIKMITNNRQDTLDKLIDKIDLDEFGDYDG